MPPGGVPEWSGWTFADRGFWQTEGAQGRANFTKAQGTVAVGDTQEWDDLPQLNNSFNSLFSTSPVSLANVVANTAVLVRLPRCHAPVTMHSCLCKRTNVGAWGKSKASQWELQRVRLEPQGVGKNKRLNGAFHSRICRLIERYSKRYRRGILGRVSAKVCLQGLAAARVKQVAKVCSHV